LLVATHGRGLFVLDNITPLEEFDATKSAGAEFQLFPVLPAVKWSFKQGGGFSQVGFTTPNPPTGAVIQYWLKDDLEAQQQNARAGAAGGQGGGRGAAAGGAGGGFGGGARRTPVKIVVTDSTGAKIRTFYGPAKA